jgi:phosphate transport system substrate-binding protein
MMRSTYGLRPALTILVLAAWAALFAALPAQASGPVSHALIQGSGSSWSANAVNQWIADVQANGLQVVYTASGSAQGRKDFGYRTTDFAVSEIGYQGRDPLTGEQDTSQGRAYAYLPIVAGGTSFPYQIKVSGKMVTNLRLSGETLTKIFTLKITNWNDPEITRDNNGHALPALPIIPVVHSEGSGSTAQLTRYFDTEYPSIWRAYLGGSGLTEYYPRKGVMVAQSGSDGVMNFVSSKAANGSIGYDEYSYALAKGYPVAKVENAAGYYQLPTQYNVAVALTQAVINQDKTSPNYLLQNLDKVYVYSDPRTYPISSYSYMIIPTAPSPPETKMTTAKRQTLSDFLYYSICEGQKEMGPIGYSPLPINLVTAGFSQIAKLRNADANVDLSQRDVSTCNNPTFVAGQPTRNYLAEIAPQPISCDKDGQGPCTGQGDPGTSASTTSPTPSSDPTTSAQPTPTPGTSASPGTSSSVAVKPGAKSPSADPSTVGHPAAGTTGGNVVADPVAGQPVAVAEPAPAVPVSLASYRSRNLQHVLAPLAVALLLIALIAPPLAARRLAHGRGQPPDGDE